ncbi:hypothetical protein [Streptomyces sp. NPDC093970]|uniref:hypothetical protein n=1 Tax=Streptomyces sp. NPDC093970 TaxID=3155076 RepID=UPI003422665E
MFGKRFAVGMAIAMVIGTLGACSGGDGGGDTARESGGTTSDGYGSGSVRDTGSGQDSTPSVRDDSVHGLKEAVRHVGAKTVKATRPHLVPRCTTATRRVRHTSTSRTGGRRTTRTWYTTERHRSCTKVRSGTETYRRTVRTEKWCVELDDVNGVRKRDDVWYEVSRSVYGDALTADRHARLEFVPARESC